MTNDPERPHRRSIRLKEYDYSQVGAYFITIVTQDQACLFGEIMDGKMHLNDAGRMVEKGWLELNRKFPTIETDEYIVMPNHFHGIVVIVGADLRVCPDTTVGADLCVCPDVMETDPRVYPCELGAHAGAPLQQSGTHVTKLGAHIGAPLPSIIQWFKTMTTNEYIRGVKTSGWLPFRGRLWQRNYYEHIIRDDESLNSIREYITNNPLQWEMDRENPVRALGNVPMPKDEPWRI